MKKWPFSPWQTSTFAILAVIVLSASSCDSSSANNKETNITDRQFQTYADVQPVHFYNFSVPRDIMLQIYDAKMQAVPTWTVWYALDGKPIGFCPSLGYPIPGGTQLTNPMRANNGYYSLPQGEPDGLFPPTTSAGTWVLCVRDGKNEATYVEPNVVTYAHPIEVRNGEVVDLGGKASTTIQIKDSTATKP